MPLYEYLTIPFKDAADMEVKINEYGRQGWEFLTIIRDYLLYFKRQLPAPKQPGPSETK